MDDLETLASSRGYASGRKSSDGEVQVSALQALKRPLQMLAVIFVPPLLFLLLYLLADPWSGHPQIPWPLIYVALVGSLAAPIGLWASVAAFNRHASVRGRALISCVLFLALTIVSWFWLAPQMSFLFT